MISKNGRGLAVIILFLFMEYSNAQDSPKPSFDVASIKPVESCVQTFSAGNTTMAMMTPPIMAGGRFSACNSLEGFIKQAYQIDDASQLSGHPAWSKTAQFKIEAKTDPEAGADQMRLMLQTLLEERSKLKIHRESRELETYSLVVAKSGHKLQPAKDENGNPITALPPSEPSPENIKAALAKIQSGQKMKPGPGTLGVIARGNGPLELEAKAVQLSRFATFLRQMVGKKVIDKTSLEGFFDIKLQYAAEPGRGPILIASQSTPAAGDANRIPEPELSGPTIFNALRDQLGLELQPDKGEFDFFTVDSVEKPSEN